MRIKSLDALRGLAALWVLLAHALSVVDGLLQATDPLVRFTPLRLLTGARFPVIFFFVLSGFVLSLQFLSGRYTGYATFAVRRFCRIYLPFAASILLAWALYLAVGSQPVPAASDNWNENGVGSTSVGALLRHLLMIGRVQDMNLNGVMWSLVVEMRVSLIFPALMLVTLAWPLAALAAALSFITFEVITALGQTALYGGETVALSWLLTAYFLFPFTVGIVVARSYATIPKLRGALSVAAIAGLLLALLFVQRLSSAAVKDVGYAIIAGGLIAVTLGSDRLQGTLNRPILQWFGRVSYSLYLVHVPIITALIRALSPHLSLGYIVVLAVGVALIAAQLMYRWVERPAKGWGEAFQRHRTPKVLSPAHPTGWGGRAGS